MAENPFELLENDEELQALQSISTKVNKIAFIRTFQNKVFKVAVHDLFKQKQAQLNNVQKNREATIASNTMLKAEIEEASKSYNNTVSALENLRTVNMNDMKDLIRETEFTSKMQIRFENNTKKGEEDLQKSKDKWFQKPLVQEWGKIINEKKNIINEITEKENLNNALILDVKRRQNDVAEQDKQRIMELSKFMLEERPKLIKKIVEKERERVNLKEEIIEKQKVEKQPKKISLPSSQNIPNDILSTTRDLSFMWKKTYTISTKDKKSESDIKEDSFFSSYMKYFNKTHSSTIKANANKQNLMDILEDLPREENGNKSKVPDCEISIPVSSKTKDLQNGNKKMDQVERKTVRKFKDDNLDNEIKVVPKRFLNDYESQGDKTTKYKITIEEKNASKQMKDETLNEIKVAPKQFQDISEIQGDAATKPKDEDVAMIIEVPHEEIQHSKEDHFQKTAESSKLNANENFFANSYMKYFSTKYSPAKGSVQKENAITILEDVPVDSSQMEGIFSKLNVNTLQPVEVIEVTKPVKEQANSVYQENEGSSGVGEENPESVILPPTMYMDSSQTEEVSNEGGAGEIETMDTQESVNDDIYTKRREMLLKSLNLDNSPDFVYTKNRSLQKEFATSKYFAQKQIKENKDGEEEVKNENTKAIANNPKEQKATETKDNQQMEDKKALSNKIEQVEVFSPNDSMNTTADDMDSSHYIDSNLLLSPKLDDEQNMQEASNFLTGMKKPEMSFFGNLLGSSSDTNKPESNDQNSGHFNFNFGSGGSGDDKKKGGGNLFNFFN